jgi:serine/threonine protein kinase
MVESFDSFQKLRPSKSMTFLPQSYIDTELIQQIGNYKLGIELGSGAFGKVVLGKHIITGETVAIKILDKKILNKTPEDYDLVKKEMDLPGRLLESVAYRIADRLMERFELISSVHITLYKINPPMGGDCEGAGVELHLTNNKEYKG